MKHPRKPCQACGEPTTKTWCKPCGYQNRAKTGFKPGHPVFGGVETRFNIGQTPWNKGTKGLTVANSGSIRPFERRSPETEIKKGQFVDERHPWWKGDEVGYYALHTWVGRKLGRKHVCQWCNKKVARTEFANLDFEYTRDLETWAELCPKCHKGYDSSNGWGLATKKWGWK